MSSILQEYADKVSGGKWKLKPSFKIREDEHSKLIHFLCNIGIKFGFNVYSGHSSATYEGIKVSELPNYLDIKNLKSINDIQLSKIKGDRCSLAQKTVLSTVYSKLRIPLELLML